MSPRLARIMMLCLLALLSLAAQAYRVGADGPQQAPGGRPWRILHIMSERSALTWSDEQLSGFKIGLGNDLQVEYQIEQLDARQAKSQAQLAERAQAVRKHIQEWKPDLLYVSDDAALDLVARHFADKPLPCVFSGVQQELASYGLAHAKNFTGVLEQVSFVESLHLLDQLKPGITRIHLIADASPYNKLPIERIRRLSASQDNIRLVGVDTPETLQDFQALILKNPKKAEAFVLLGDARYKTGKQETVSLPQLHRWLATHSQVPEIAFRAEQIRLGALAGVTSSALGQGFLAGQKARKILIYKAKPSTIPVEIGIKSLATFNLARARALDIVPRAQALLSSVVHTDFEWDRE